MVLKHVDLHLILLRQLIDQHVQFQVQGEIVAAEAESRFAVLEIGRGRHPHQ